MNQEVLEHARERLDHLARSLGVQIASCGCCGGARLESTEVAGLEIDGHIGSQREPLQLVDTPSWGENLPTLEDLEVEAGIIAAEYVQLYDWEKEDADH